MVFIKKKEKNNIRAPQITMPVPCCKNSRIVFIADSITVGQKAFREPENLLTRKSEGKDGFFEGILKHLH